MKFFLLVLAGILFQRAKNWSEGIRGGLEYGTSFAGGFQD
jgi:hypothetical protein